MLAAAACNAASCAAAAAGGAAAAEGAAPALPADPGELPPTKVPARPPAASSSESPELEDEAQPRRPPLNRTVRPLRLPVGGAARCASCCCRTASIRPCPCRGDHKQGVAKGRGQGKSSAQQVLNPARAASASRALRARRSSADPKQPTAGLCWTALAHQQHALEAHLHLHKFALIGWRVGV